MIRVLNAYYSKRTIVLFLCEAVLIIAAFFLATAYQVGPDAYIALIYQNGLVKILGVCAFTLLLSYYFDLYEPQLISGSPEIQFRLLLVVGSLSICLAIAVYLFPYMDVGPSVFLVGTALVAALLLVWRPAYARIMALPILRERVFVLGRGERADYVLGLLRSRSDLGVEIVEGSEDSDGDYADAIGLLKERNTDVDRIVLALEDRRGSMPLEGLLQLRLRGAIVEEAATMIERLTGRVPLEGLNPSAMIFTEGFNIRPTLLLARRLFSILVSSIALALCLPLIPFLILAVRLSSPGPIFFKQIRCGLEGKPFTIYKFRTMRADAEANGAQWAKKNDSRITPLGRFMRKTRLDEIPQLWNVLRGDMGFVGPRPERPEFVDWLAKEIPYYHLRHMIRPGITGWAQVRYQYGASLEETKRKLEFDLYYIKHISLGLDLLVMFETVKTIIFRRGQ